MLCQLSIENIALIDKLSLELKDGLNILSGETGAGKSIIIDSLNFVLGERADNLSSASAPTRQALKLFLKITTHRRLMHISKIWA